MMMMMMMMIPKRISFPRKLPTGCSVTQDAVSGPLDRDAAGVKLQSKLYHIKLLSCSIVKLQL